MRALSVRQPYASFIARGLKTVETRKWSTPHRGELLICASQNPDIAALQAWAITPAEFQDSYPVGVALCVVTVRDCVRMTAAHVKPARCGWYDGAWAWLLGEPRAVKPLKVRGSLGLFNVDGDLIEDGSQVDLLPEEPPF